MLAEEEGASTPRLAVTGGTGFVGGHLLRIAAEQGYAIRALARAPQPAMAGVDWVQGDLADAAALDALCAGADVVIHIAGVINARDRAGFDAGNVAGTVAMRAAAARAGVRRFVHVSSLAAREPRLSAYGASKAAAEALFSSAGDAWTIIRPPGVYGPGDRETLALFQMVATGWALLPGKGRVSMLEVSDLARALLAVLGSAMTHGKTCEISDGAPLTQAELARVIGTALAVEPEIVALPTPVLYAAALVDTLRSRFAGKLPRLSFDRARYLAHPDWVAHGDNLNGIWTPQVALADGIAATATWYRAAGWLS